ncbi:hypothetical protein RRG08_027243 [Elysia crispata]|uniref:Short-chain dehydrogenase/reductase 3 n=1 Tax=Elysia crispata TaxID=231223 RepID=A0AAE0ZUC9_9GAST|nr:hypothetical protein RRG08_027243 [Elysia crispata]
MSFYEAIYEVCEVLFVVIFNYIVALVRVFVPPAKKSIHGKVVLVTGAGRGIGREIAMELTKHGAVLALWDVNTEGNEETARMVTEAGCKALADTVDVTSSTSIAEGASKIRKALGEVDILINNAGVVNCAELLDLTEKAIRRVYEVNILAQYWTIREFLPSMIERKSGHIVNVSSLSSAQGQRMFTDYGASKAAVCNFTEGLRRELEYRNRGFVKVTLVVPRFTDTGMLRTGEFPKSQTLMPQQVSEAIVDGLLRNYTSVYIPPSTTMLLRISALLPSTTVDYLVAKNTPPMTAQFKKED